MSDIPRTRDVLSEHLYLKVFEICPDDSHAVTGMLLECSESEIYEMLQNLQVLRHRVMLSLQTITRNRKKDEIGEELYQKVQDILNEEDTVIVGKVTGMLMELDTKCLHELISCPTSLQSAVDKAVVTCIYSSQLHDPSNLSNSHHESFSEKDKELKEKLGEILYHKIEKICPTEPSKITGMILELDSESLKKLTSDDEVLIQYVDKAKSTLLQQTT